MLNKEKYAKEIVDIAIGGWCLGLKNGKPFKCACLRCDECDFNSDDCSEEFAKWANSEYIEPTVDWSKVPVDTPILVRDFDNEKWRRRYFAKFEHAQVYAWSDGGTSWNMIATTSWRQAKLAESKENNDTECNVSKKVKGIHLSKNTKDNEIFGVDARFGHCPTCDEYVCTMWNACYCGNCGQKLKWSE